MVRRMNFTGTVKSKFDRMFDYSPVCNELLETMGMEIANMLWLRWDEWYYGGLLPEKVCERWANCPSTLALDDIKMPLPVDDTRFNYFNEFAKP
jgi:hypothetical protein